MSRDRASSALRRLVDADVGRRHGMYRKQIAIALERGALQLEKELQDPVDRDKWGSRALVVKLRSDSDSGEES